MEVVCSSCGFPIYAERIGEKIKCIWCGAEGIAEAPEGGGGLAGLAMVAAVLIGIVVASTSKSRR